MSYQVDDFMFNTIIANLEAARILGLEDMGLLEDLKEKREEKFAISEVSE
jgi:hypothetical protein